MKCTVGGLGWPWPPLTPQTQQTTILSWLISLQVPVLSVREQTDHTAIKDRVVIIDIFTMDGSGTGPDGTDKQRAFSVLLSHRADSWAIRLWESARTRESWQSSQNQWADPPSPSSPSSPSRTKIYCAPAVAKIQAFQTLNILYPWAGQHHKKKKKKKIQSKQVSRQHLIHHITWQPLFLGLPDSVLN